MKVTDELRIFISWPSNREIILEYLVGTKVVTRVLTRRRKKRRRSERSMWEGIVPPLLALKMDNVTMSQRMQAATKRYKVKENVCSSGTSRKAHSPDSTEKWRISCHINKQVCHSHQWFQPPNVNFWAQKEPRKNSACYLAAISHFPWWSLRTWDGGGRGGGCEKAPESWAEYERNDFSKPRLFYLPTHRKVLNSLRYLFFLN